MNEEQTIFQTIHNMDKVTNHLIIQWSKMFNGDLGISHILVLSHLKENGKSRLSDIARNLGLTPSTLTHLSEKLVKKKLVLRITDENDRRISYLSITDKGIDMIHRAYECGHALRRNLYERLADEERAQLLRIFEKLTETL